MRLLRRMLLLTVITLAVASVLLVYQLRSVAFARTKLIIEAADSLGRHDGGVWGRMSPSARLWFDRQGWDFSRCAKESPSLDTNSILLQCARRGVWVYFDQECGSGWKQFFHFMKLAVCSRDLTLQQITAQIRNGDWMTVYMMGEPLADIRALEPR